MRHLLQSSNFIYPLNRHLLILIKTQYTISTGLPYFRKGLIYGYTGLLVLTPAINTIRQIAVYMYLTDLVDIITALYTQINRLTEPNYIIIYIVSTDLRVLAIAEYTIKHAYISSILYYIPFWQTYLIKQQLNIPFKQTYWS